MGTYSYSGLLCCLSKEIVDILLFCGAPLCPVIVTSLEVITASLQVFRRSSRYKSGVVNASLISTGSMVWAFVVESLSEDSRQRLSYTNHTQGESFLVDVCGSVIHGSATLIFIVVSPLVRI